MKNVLFLSIVFSCKQCTEISLVSSVSTQVFVNLSQSSHGLLFLFLPTSGLLSISAEPWWHSTYKFNLCRSLLVPFRSTAFSCPSQPTQVFHKPMLCSWMTGRVSRAYPSPQRLKAQDLLKVSQQHQIHLQSASHTICSSQP